MTAPISDTITLNITRDTVGVSRAGFGTPLFLSNTAAWAGGERTRTYTSLADVAVDFATTTSPEYLAAQAVFSQTPKPRRMKIGRAALPATMVYTMTVVVRNSYTYSVKVSGSGITTTTVTYTSDGSATDAEIATGLVAAINGVAANNYIAAGGASPFTVTADSAGGWFALEVNPADITARQSHVDPGIATDLTAIALEDPDWYGLVTTYNSNAVITAAAAWVESNKRLYFADTDNTLSVTAVVAGGGNDIADLAHTAAYKRTAIMYHANAAFMLGGALAGRYLPTDPGAATAKFKQLALVTPSSLTGTYRTNLRAKYANWFEASGGRNMLFDGTVAGTDYIDVTRDLDWLEDDMLVGTFAALSGTDKVDYDDDGAELIAAEVRASLRRAVDRRILKSDPAPVVEVPLVADMTVGDIAARTFGPITWSAKLRGAIHEVTINGVVSL